MLAHHTVLSVQSTEHEWSYAKGNFSIYFYNLCTGHTHGLTHKKSLYSHDTCNEKGLLHKLNWLT